jgi:nucleotide-binding universal stress UspA family protein
VSEAPQAEPEESTSGFEIGTDGVTSVVVGYDGTDPARDALAFGAGIARRGGGRLLVAFVATTAPLTALAPAGAYVQTQTQQEEATQFAAEVKDFATELGVAVEWTYRQGDVARELEAYAEAEKADVIVVGRSSARAHAVIGSVAVALVRHAKRPIAVVP